MIPEVVIAPPALYLLLAKEITKNGVEVAAQNIYDKGDGAYTGEISAQQLKDAGVHWVILGHSERRSIFAESDEVCPLASPVDIGVLIQLRLQFVASKTKAALDAGLNVILCIGESLEV